MAYTFCAPPQYPLFECTTLSAPKMKSQLFSNKINQNIRAYNGSQGDTYELIINKKSIVVKKEQLELSYKPNNYFYQFLLGELKLILSLKGEPINRKGNLTIINRNVLKETIPITCH